MLINLDEHELELLIVALRYWRSHRGESATRRTDAVLTPDDVKLLIGKLGATRLTTLTSERIFSDLFPH